MVQVTGTIYIHFDLPEQRYQDIREYNNTN